MDRAKRPLFVSVALAAATLLLYWPTRGHGFVNFDDWGYIIQNPQVNGGLHWQTVQWAFTSTYASNWHPLTWLSHALDCQLFGLNAGGHHFTNMLLHTANAVLVFLVLQSLIRGQWSVVRSTSGQPDGPVIRSSRGLAIWRCAFVAALFGLHPMHVESVAWIAERKDVLSTFFFLLTIWAYAKFVKSKVLDPEPNAPSSSIEGPALTQYAAGNTQHTSRITFSAIAWYVLALLLFACGLMSKAMVVTLPFVLLLLDFWPLGRVPDDGRCGTPGWVAWRGLVLEKVPFLAMSAVDSVLTFVAQHSTGATASFEAAPFDNRVANALLSYGLYLKKVVWPDPMAVYYPFRDQPPIIPTVASVLVLIVLSVIAIRQRRSRPYLLVGWCWFLGTLVPVIGLVQVGLQSMADRYTYIPYIGLFVAIIWTVADVLEKQVFSIQHSVFSKDRTEIAALESVPLSTEHRTPNTRAIIPRVLIVVVTLAILTAFFLSASAQLRYWANSETLWRHTVKVTEGNAVALQNLGSGLVEQRRFAEAGEQFQEALKVKPLYADAASNFGFVLAAQGRLDEAIEQYRNALGLKPSIAQTHYLLGSALLTKGDRPGAIEEFRTALNLKPDLPPALNDLAWVLASDPDPNVRNGSDAVSLAERACEITRFREPQMIGTLAAAYAEVGRFPDAISTAENAKTLAKAIGRTDLVERNTELMALYREGKPYREVPLKLSGDHPKNAQE